MSVLANKETQNWSTLQKSRLGWVLLLGKWDRMLMILWTFLIKWHSKWEAFQNFFSSGLSCYTLVVDSVWGHTIHDARFTELEKRSQQKRIYNRDKVMLKASKCGLVNVISMDSQSKLNEKKVRQIMRLYSNK